MTILTDHLNIDRSEDPGYWYIWALDFKNTFLFLYDQTFKLLNSKNINLDQLPSQPGNISILTIYFSTLELYMKTFLLANKSFELSLLKTKYRHKLSEIREKCADIDNRFNNENLKWIIDTMEKSIKSDWSQIKYPLKRAPLLDKKADRSKDAGMFGLFGKKTMLPPLELLEEIVKPLVYIED